MKRFYIILIISLCSNSIWAQYDQIGHDFGNGLRRVRKGYYYGFIDANDNVVVPVIYTYLEEFTGGRTRVVGHQQYYKDVFIDKTGKAYAPYESVNISLDLGDGIRIFETCNKSGEVQSGLMDNDGNEILEPRNRSIFHFNKNDSCFYADDYLINKHGQLVVPYKVHDGLNGNGYAMIENNGRYGLTDMHSGKVVVPPKYQSVRYPHEGMIGVITEKGAGFLDASTYEIKIPFVYDNVGSFSEGLAPVEKNGKLGFIDLDGILVIPFNKFEEGFSARPFWSGGFRFGLCIVGIRNNGKLQEVLIDKSGKILTPLCHDIANLSIESGFTVCENEYPRKVAFYDLNCKRHETKKECEIAQFAIIKSRAETGHPQFYTVLGDIYSDDEKSRARGLSGKDDKQAFYWFMKAVGSIDKSKNGYWGESAIYYKIGECYEKGLGVEQNLVEAKRWYKKSYETSCTSMRNVRYNAYTKLVELGADLSPIPQPNPIPSGDYAHITWLDFPDIISQSELTLELAINSDTKIKNVSIIVNGAQDRGIKTTENSNHEMMIIHPISLLEGKNTIQVKVVNSAGITQEEKTIDYLKESKDTPIIEWLDFASTASKQDYQLKLGIKSQSKIEDVSITLNGVQSRGVKTTESDEYVMMVNRTVTLAEGTNHVVVSVCNAEGISTSEKVITYNGITPKPIIKEKRIALVIGNSKYEGNVNPLTNPYNDATDIGKILKKLGFETTVLYDGTKKEMNNAVSLFVEKAREYDVALFYYAGHGLQLQTDIGGTNYLIPVDAQLVYKCDAEDCVSANRVVAQLEASGCNIRLIILDACRDLPNLKECQRGSSNGGFSEISSTVGTYIMYSTREGKTAEDGKGHNSPFAEGFLKFIEEKNLPVETFFKKVGEWVDEKTGFKQSPWPSGRIRGNFYFNKQN